MGSLPALGACTARQRARVQALKTNDGVAATLAAQYDKAYRIAFADTFHEYLDILDSRLANFDLPLDANLDRLPSGQVALQVPKVTLMDLYVFPTSTLEITHDPPGVATIRAVDTAIEGSHHIEQLDLNDRFELDLDIRLYVEGDIMRAGAAFCLNVDVPFPFNVTPRSVLEGAGGAACDRVLSSLMDTLCVSIVRDHATWAAPTRRRGGHGSSPLPAGARPQAPVTA